MSPRCFFDYIYYSRIANILVNVNAEAWRQRKTTKTTPLARPYRYPVSLLFGANGVKVVVWTKFFRTKIHSKCFEHRLLCTKIYPYSIKRASSILMNQEPPKTSTTMECAAATQDLETRRINATDFSAMKSSEQASARNRKNDQDYPPGDMIAPSSPEEEENGTFISSWSPTVQVAEFHPSVPLDIALLHIETDLLLDSLRASASSPKMFSLEVSPASNSTSESTASASTTTCTESNDARFRRDYEDDDDSNDDSVNTSVCSDDDGMRGEIQNLATSEMQLSLDLITSYRTIGTTKKNGLKTQQPDERIVSKPRIPDTEDTFLLLVKEILMLCEDTTRLVIRNDNVKHVLQSKPFQTIANAIRSPPRAVWISFSCLYVLLFVTSLWLKLSHRVTME